MAKVTASICSLHHLKATLQNCHPLVSTTSMPQALACMQHNAVKDMGDVLSSDLGQPGAAVRCFTYSRLDESFSLLWLMLTLRLGTQALAIRLKLDSRSREHQTGIS